MPLIVYLYFVHSNFTHSYYWVHWLSQLVQHSSIVWSQTLLNYPFGTYPSPTVSYEGLFIYAPLTVTWHIPHCVIYTTTRCGPWARQGEGDTDLSRTGRHCPGQQQVWGYATTRPAQHNNTSTATTCLQANIDSTTWQRLCTFWQLISSHCTDALVLVKHECMWDYLHHYFSSLFRWFLLPFVMLT